MKQPGFPRFLNQYCIEITGIAKTSSIRRLARALPQHPRLVEPLTLYALTEGRENLLLSEISNYEFHSTASQFVRKYKSSELGLEAFLETLPENDRFHKVYRSWVSQTSKLERDRKTLANVSKRMQELIDRKGLTRAQACRLTGLDKGNFYAFLKGDASRLSRDTAMKAYRTIDCA